MSFYDLKPPRLRPQDHLTTGTEHRGLALPANVRVVLADSPLCLRKAVWRNAQFFHGEFGYDGVPYAYEGRYVDPKCEAYIWVKSALDKRDYVLGAAAFYETQFEKRPPLRTLGWVWLHPYTRRRGQLKSLWPTLRRLQGRFWVERPLSVAMKAFLASVESDVPHEGIAALDWCRPREGSAS